MSFKLKYTATDKIRNNLTNVASAREVVEQACLSPSLESKLRQWALVRNVHASTALAGNKLTLEQVEVLCVKRKKLKKKAR